VWKGIYWSDRQEYGDQVQKTHNAISPEPVRKVSCGRAHMDTGHSTKFNSIHRLARVKEYMHRLKKEAIQIQLHLNNLNRDNGFLLGKTWQPLLLQLRNNTANHIEKKHSGL
jgi:hypothetical protein